MKYTSIIRFYFPIEAFTLSAHKFAFCSSKLGSFLDILTIRMKKRYVRVNQSSFMTLNLRKAIMKRSKLRNKFLKERSEISR